MEILDISGAGTQHPIRSHWKLRPGPQSHKKNSKQQCKRHKANTVTANTRFGSSVDEVVVRVARSFYLRMEYNCIGYIGSAGTSRISLLLRLNFSHYELPITYIKEFLVEILTYRP